MQDTGVSFAVAATPNFQHSTALRGASKPDFSSGLSAAGAAVQADNAATAGSWLAACTGFVVSLATAGRLRFGPRAQRRAATQDGTSKPRVLVVNLDKSVDRWEKCTEEFAKQNVEAERFPAVLGKALSEEERNENVTFGARYFCTAGMIGCFMSHLGIWKKVVKEDIPYVVVLEDDVVLYPDFTEKLKTLLEELPEGWDVCLLGAVGCVNQDREPLSMKSYGWLTGGSRASPGKTRTISPHLFVPYKPAGTHAYMISRKGAEVLANACPKARFHVDLTAWSVPQLKLYCAKDYLATQRFDESDTTVSKGGAPLTKRFLEWCWSVGGFASLVKQAGVPNLTWAWKTAVFAVPLPFSSNHKRFIIEAGPAISLWVMMLLSCIPLRSLKMAGVAFAYLGCITFMIRWLSNTLQLLPLVMLAAVSAACFLV
eukprot:TRINITY_DN34948_c0_g1_i1.p1 TRINITY_DN34948_c0_g1~~TRINITY_DN34948_c0_g1_i1.p1  ORF type:complete len:428 (-),score=72.35 TRINITY_DN34948_c0_g1_i1:114-1397(-)